MDFLQLSVHIRFINSIVSSRYQILEIYFLKLFISKNLI